MNLVLRKSCIEQGLVKEACVYETPLRSHKNGLIKMKIAYSAFLQDMDFKTFVLHQCWSISSQTL